MSLTPYKAHLQKSDTVNFSQLLATMCALHSIVSRCDNGLTTDWRLQPLNAGW